VTWWYTPVCLELSVINARCAVIWRGHIGVPGEWNWPWVVSPNIPSPGDPIPASSGATLFAHRPQRRYPPPHESWINPRTSVHIIFQLRNRRPRQKRAMVMRVHFRATRKPGVQEEHTQEQRAQPWRLQMRKVIDSEDIGNSVEYQLPSAWHFYCSEVGEGKLLSTTICLKERQAFRQQGGERPFLFRPTRGPRL
jgi:hypothetical protein